VHLLMQFADKLNLDSVNRIVLAYSIGGVVVLIPGVVGLLLFGFSGDAVGTIVSPAAITAGVGCFVLGYPDIVPSCSQRRYCYGIMVWM
jgi:hypothetical protein